MIRRHTLRDATEDNTECMLYSHLSPLLRDSLFVPPVYRQQSFHVVSMEFGFPSVWLWQGIVQIGSLVQIMAIRAH